MNNNPILISLFFSSKWSHRIGFLNSKICLITQINEMISAKVGKSTKFIWYSGFHDHTVHFFRRINATSGRKKLKGISEKLLSIRPNIIVSSQL